MAGVTTIRTCDSTLVLLNDDVVEIGDDFDHGVIRLDCHNVDDRAEQVGGLIKELHDGNDQCLHTASP